MHPTLVSGPESDRDMTDSLLDVDEAQLLQLSGEAFDDVAVETVLFVKELAELSVEADYCVVGWHGVVVVATNARQNLLELDLRARAEVAAGVSVSGGKGFPLVILEKRN